MKEKDYMRDVDNYRIRLDEFYTKVCFWHVFPKYKYTPVKEWKYQLTLLIIML